MNTMECAKQLGETLFCDPVLVEYRRAKEAFEQDSDLGGKMAEYNTQRTLLGQEFAKDTAMQDADLILKLRARIDTLYEEVNSSPVYLAYTAAGQKVTELMNKVNGEISFYAFGERPCTHDCASCSGCHG